MSREAAWLALRVQGVVTNLLVAPRQTGPTTQQLIYKKKRNTPPIHKGIVYLITIYITNLEIQLIYIYSLSFLYVSQIYLFHQINIFLLFFVYVYLKIIIMLRCIENYINLIENRLTIEWNYDVYVFIRNF